MKTPGEPGVSIKLLGGPTCQGIQALRGLVPHPVPAHVAVVIPAAVAPVIVVDMAADREMNAPDRYPGAGLSRRGGDRSRAQHGRRDRRKTNPPEPFILHEGHLTL